MYRGFHRNSEESHHIKTIIHYSSASAIAEIWCSKFCVTPQGVHGARPRKSCLQIFDLMVDLEVLDPTDYGKIFTKIFSNFLDF